MDYPYYQYGTEGSTSPPLTVNTIISMQRAQKEVLKFLMISHSGECSQIILDESIPI